MYVLLSVFEQIVFGKIEIEQKGAKMWAPQMAQKMSHCHPPKIIATISLCRIN